MPKHVAVLMGGMSKEREVSLSTGEGVVKHLTEMGYKVTAIDMDENVAEKLKKAKPDVAFIALHGTYGEDGRIQGLLEIMKIPYTHSGFLASAVAMEKNIAKKFFIDAGITMPPGKLYEVEELFVLARKKKLPMKKPFVVKPVNNGSSVGVFIFHKKDKFVFREKDWEYGPYALVEKYIPGRELACAVLDGKAIGVIELRPHKGFYDYQAKYTAGKTLHLMPAPIHPKAYKQVMNMAEKAHQALGCRGVTRADFRYDDTNGEPGKLYLLEVNTHPGMTPLSLVPEIAAHAGISFDELLERLVKSAKMDI